MDQKSWLWKKRSTEKTLVVADKPNNSLSRNEEDVTEELLNEKAELEGDLRILNDKLSSALSECTSKDNMAKKQVKIAQEAIAGWEKAETEATSLKKDLDRALQEKAASEERLGHLEAALKECMQQLRFVRDEQEKRVHGAVVKTLEEFEKTRLLLDEKLAEADKKLVRLAAENTQLNKALSGKDKVIEELSKYRAEVEGDFKALMLRVESTEKENASLKYEVRVLEKELDIRNEEREFNRRTSDVAQKKQQESVKRIAKLELECQRLRLLVQKRLPGPAALKKMKNEVEILGRRKSNPSLINSTDFHGDVASETPSKRVNFLTEQLHIMEEENRSLKYALNRKSSELQSSRSVYARAASSPRPFFLQEHSMAASSDVGSDDKASCAESWASALISELEHFKSEKQLATPPHRSVVTSDMNLMDDFAEMEKLAVVSVDYLPGSSPEASVPEKENNMSTMKKSGEKLESDVSLSIQKILHLIEGINISSQDKGVAESFPGRNSDTPNGYTVRVFQWKTDELSAILEKFVKICNDLLNGTADVEQFAQLVASNLDWVMNHCFSIQDVSSIKDTIKSRLDWDESRSESEVDSGSANHSAESNGLQITKGESFRIQLQDSKDIIGNLHSRIETMKQSYDKIEKQKIIMETSSHPENDMEKQNSTFEKQEESSNDLKLQLNSLTSKEDPGDGKNWEKQLRNDWEITAASEKLAECQETILNLGKQLKALASPKDAILFNKVISTPADTSISTPQRSISRRSSLLNKMQLDDNDQTGGSLETKDDILNGNNSSGVSTNAAIESWGKFSDPNGIGKNAVVSMAIVPVKKNEGRSFLKKLFWRKKKDYSKKKTPFS
ncbi:hypothetical protein BUALT_Bualt04G0109900 [Buddleja alternifolia]|uniref:Filament-like plant protein 7 n=1 Tax=Buddleja alternifolia TaxID=168488 RepID=A0AAV6XN15_9LAMI|nr:hypothetical protein BUALT_Bualt04G0109900 [Buddleja alternifolia]